MKKGATFDPTRTYRYSLFRQAEDPTDWYGQPGKSIAFIGLNPSTADEVDNDPTVTRCLHRTAMWRYQTFWMLNVFALRSTDPKALYKSLDPLGPENLYHIGIVCRKVDTIVCCWGTHGNLANRGQELVNMLCAQGLKGKLFCLGHNKNGTPKHPLYVAYNKELEPYQMEQ